MEKNAKMPDDLLPEPYLHIDSNSIYNPLTDRHIDNKKAYASKLRNWATNNQYPESLTNDELNLLLSEEWLISRQLDQDGRFRLMYVSLETHTLCNQKCYFCPVSVAPRNAYFMSTVLFKNILQQLTAFRSNLLGVFLHNYNEPTLNPNFINEIAQVLAHDLPVAINTNASGLTPTRVDEMLKLGGLDYLSVNLSTLDADEYTKTRGHNHLSKVIRNLNYIADKPIAKRMDIAVLGQQDQSHNDAFLAIKANFGQVFNVNQHKVNNRSGNIEMGMRQQPHDGLNGCDLLGSRPLQHIHIDPYGKCLLCCQDYAGNHILGDLTLQTIGDVLSSPAARQYRRWVYGKDAAAADFICRKYEYARATD